MKKILVTGGAGFIGSHITEALVKRGFFVRVLDNLSSGSLENLDHIDSDSLEFIKGDIYDYEIVYESMRNVEAVFHEAALVSVPISMEAPLASVKNNALGTVNIFEGARKIGVKKVIFASSAAVYGNPSHNNVISENDPIDPLSPYGLDKYYAEKMAKIYSENFDISIIGLRYFNVYGDRQNPSSPYSGVLSIFIDQIKKGQTLKIFGDGKQTRDFVYVEDVVGVNLLAMKSNISYGIYNVGTGINVSLNEIIELIKRETDYFVRVNYENERLGDIKHSSADISLMKKKLDFTPKHIFHDTFLKLLKK